MDARIAELLSRPENKFCADCRAADPQWCSVSIGIVICTECAGIHRKLGTHLSFVQSVEMDTWKDAWIQRLDNIGNQRAAKMYEERFPSSWPRPRLTAFSGAGNLERFVRAKYEHKLFANRATKILDEFYDNLRQQHLDERQRMQMHNVKVSRAKSNRQEAYIDEVQRAAAYTASAEFLASHQEWLSGGSALSYTELMARVALQHFIASDVEDLSLEQRKKKNSDVFDSVHNDVCEQFLKDATRSKYIIRGEELDFQQDFESIETANAENTIDALAEKFTERLVAALRQGLGGNPPPILLRTASIILSQSGMAHLERACCSPPVVVSGGQQLVEYELELCKPGVWEMKLSTAKVGFREAVVYPRSHSGTEDATKHIPTCRPGSKVSKSVVIVLTLEETDRICVDVRSLEDDVRLLDEHGSLHKIDWSQSFADRFLVLLCRASPSQPLGLAPCRQARCRGVLKLNADAAPDSPADAWNQMQDDSSTKLSAGDFVISVNEVPVSHEDDAWKELKATQVVLEVRRIRALGVARSFEQVLVDVYSLFNPGKLDSLPELLARGNSQSLLAKVCSKYVKGDDDWQELMRSLLKHGNNNMEIEKAVSKAETRLQQLDVGERAEFFVAFCRHLIEKASIAATDFNSALHQGDHCTSVDGWYSWPQLQVTMQLQDASAPLGIRHDREVLVQQKIFKVKEVLPQTPASSSGLRSGDVLESIGGVDAVEVAQGGRQKALSTLKENGGMLKIILRRQPLVTSAPALDCGDSESDTSELDFRVKFTNSLIEEDIGMPRNQAMEDMGAQEEVELSMKPSSTSQTSDPEAQSCKNVSKREAEEVMECTDRNSAQEAEVLSS